MTTMADCESFNQTTIQGGYIFCSVTTDVSWCELIIIIIIINKITNN